MQALRYLVRSVGNAPNMFTHDAIENAQNTQKTTVLLY